MKSPSRKATLLFLIRNDEILLAMKKRGFGKDRWNGVGGKPEGDESIEQTAIRECQEEIGVTPQKISEVATINFNFPKEKSDWSQQVLVYLCNDWQGKPTETDEMRPQWFNTSSIPYDEMWEDDKYWLPRVLAGEYVNASFQFTVEAKMIEQQVTTKDLRNE